MLRQSSFGSATAVPTDAHGAEPHATPANDAAVDGNPKKPAKLSRSFPGAGEIQ